MAAGLGRSSIWTSTTSFVLLWIFLEVIDGCCVLLLQRSPWHVSHAKMHLPIYIVLVQPRALTMRSTVSQPILSRDSVSVKLFQGSDDKMGFRLGWLQSLLPPWGVVEELVSIIAHREQILQQVGTQHSPSLLQYIVTILHCWLNTLRNGRRWKREDFSAQTPCLISKLKHMLMRWWNWKGPGTVGGAIPRHGGDYVLQSRTVQMH